MNKQIRCKTRKSQKTCEKDPDVCHWHDNKCNYNTINKDVKKDKDEVVLPKRVKSIRCILRKSKTTCDKDPDVCVWRNDKCEFIPTRQESRQSTKQLLSPIKLNVNTHRSISERNEVSRKSLKRLLSPTAIKKLDRIRLRMEVRKAAKPLLYKNAGDIAQRVLMYTIVTRYLTDVQSCLTWDSVQRRLFLGDVIDLTKQIGSVSNYGVAYMSKGRGFGKLIKVACKIMPITKTNQSEVKILHKVSQEVLSGRFMNFPLLYLGLECDTPLCNNKQDCPSIFLTKKYMTVINELANGDLKQWVNSRRRTMDEYISAMFQIYLGIAKFQGMGYVHNDMHWGNALYHTVTAGGWWWYKVGLQDYYVKNTGQMWVLWDFGMATKYKFQPSTNPYNYKDFYRITHAFIDKSKNGWMEDVNMYPKDLTEIAYRVQLAVHRQDQMDFNDIYAKMISYAKRHKLLLPVTTQRPDGVINKSAFIVL